MKSTLLKVLSFVIVTMYCFDAILYARSSEGKLTDKSSSAGYIPVDRNAAWEMSLNGEWKFKFNGPENVFYKSEFDVSGWPEIKVPGNWEVQGFEEPVYKEPREGVGLYRRNFEIPASWEKRRIIIRFEGVLYGFEFWVNGQHAGRFESPFNRSEYDITNLVEQGKPNVLAVRVYRRYKGWQFDTHDAWALSGIYRDVILFSVPESHINDLTIVTDVNPDLSGADVICEIKVARSQSELQNLTLSAVLKEPNGNIVDSKKLPVKKYDGGPVTTNFNFHVDNPYLWNAETPNLYSLKIDLSAGGDTLHSITRKVGIRQLSIDGDVLKLNYRAVKLRGVDHHDIHPEAGRALREEHYRQDIELMKKANINAVRTSHYPPNPVFLDLCDKYGIYVICEVPFGYGDKFLSDTSYADILLSRADATVERDKNHPSVIIWSVGNENPVTQIVVQTANRVKELDPARYRLLPGAQGSNINHSAKGEELTEFAEKTKFIFNLPESVEIAAPHYPYVKEVQGRDRALNLTDLALDKSINRPVICTEYNHALGTAFEGLQDHWEMMQKYDRLAGGCIWLWADQGLRRNTAGHKVLTDPAQRLAFDKEDSVVCADVRLDNETVLDSHGQYGTDGIVYADRFPQVDYWITRKVYSQIIIPENQLIVQTGKQNVKLSVLNRYDFTNLDGLKGTWQLMHNGNKVDSGDVSLSAPPHGKGEINLGLNLIEDIDAGEYLLKFAFTDFNGRGIYEHTVKLLPPSGKVDFAKRLSDDSPTYYLDSVGGGENISRFQFRNYDVEIDQEEGRIKLLKAGSTTPLLEGPIVRVGRVPAMAELRNYPRYNIKFWEEPLLWKGKLIDCKLFPISEEGVDAKIKLNYPSLDPDKKNEYILVNLTLHISPKGYIDIDYDLRPQNATGNFLDFGLAFQLNNSMNNLTWIGDGPYSSYPGQTNAAEPGIWHIAPKPVTDPQSRYYSGDRANVDLAIVSDGDGNGIGVICYGSTISLEENHGKQIFSQILLSAGKGNKTGGMLTLLPVKADEVKSEKGKLRIVPLESGNWPEFLNDLKIEEL